MITQDLKGRLINITLRLDGVPVSDGQKLRVDLQGRLERYEEGAKWIELRIGEKMLVRMDLADILLVAMEGNVRLGLVS